LFVATEALEAAQRRERRRKGLPERAGKPWDDIEDSQIIKGLEEGTGINELARVHQRTKGAIESGLTKLGKLTPGAAEGE
jgi:hypothetical protein